MQRDRRSGSRLAFTVWLLVSSLACESPTAPTVDELVALADAKGDDWLAEKLEARSHVALDRIGTWLAEGTRNDLPPELIARSATTTALRPEALTRERSAAGIEIRRTPAGADFGPAELSLAEGFRQLLAPFTGTGERGVKFKIVGLTPFDAKRWRTKVRCEIRGAGAAGRLQQVSYLDIDWVASGEADPPKLADIGLVSLEETSRAGPLFLDSTASALPEERGSTQLAFGGEYWYGRIDAVGELNLMGHQGLAVGDLDGDGLEDLYVAMGTGLPNKLFLQQEDGALRDVANERGVAWLDDTKGVLFADMDNDGDQDLLMTIGPTILLAKNDGQGAFERFVSMRAPTPAAFYSLSVADYDLDGDLDIYGCRYVKVAYGISVPLPFHDADNGPTNHLMRNEGEDRYVDVTLAVGLGSNNTRFSLAGVWADYDDDGDPDLYVANDFGRNNLYRNDGGRFVDVAATAGAEDQAAGMGVSWSDYDLDGDLDLYVTNMFSAAGSRIAYQPRFKSGADAGERRQIQRHASGNTLLSNRGDGSFEDVSDSAGIRMGRWGWGARFADLNGDGYDDLVVPNGFLTGALEDDL